MVTSDKLYLLTKKWQKVHSGHFLATLFTGLVLFNEQVGTRIIGTLKQKSRAVGKLDFGVIPAQASALLWLSDGSKVHTGKLLFQPVIVLLPDFFKVDHGRPVAQLQQGRSFISGIRIVPGIYLANRCKHPTSPL